MKYISSKNHIFLYIKKKNETETKLKCQCVGLLPSSMVGISYVDLVFGTQVMAKACQQLANQDSFLSTDQ